MVVLWNNGIHHCLELHIDGGNGGLGGELDLQTLPDLLVVSADCHFSARCISILRRMCLRALSLLFFQLSSVVVDLAAELVERGLVMTHQRSETQGKFFQRGPK